MRAGGLQVPVPEVVQYAGSPASLGVWKVKKGRWLGLSAPSVCVDVGVTPQVSHTCMWQGRKGTTHGGPGAGRLGPCYIRHVLPCASCAPGRPPCLVRAFGGPPHGFGMRGTSAHVAPPPQVVGWHCGLLLVGSPCWLPRTSVGCRGDDAAPKGLAGCPLRGWPWLRR